MSKIFIPMKVVNYIPNGYRKETLRAKISMLF